MDQSAYRAGWAINARLMAGTALVMVAGLLLFYRMTYIVPCDIPLHAGFVMTAVSSHQTIPNFLYYLTIYALSGFQAEMSPLLAASVVILTLALIGKYLAAYSIFIENPSGSALCPATFRWYRNWGPAAVFLLMFTHSLPVWPLSRMYVGQFPPNIWHNSTTIFLMPFALLLFQRSCKALHSFSLKDAGILLLLIVVNILIKPSFCFTLFCTFPLFMLWRYGLRREFLRALAIILLGACFIVVEYLLIYRYSNAYGGNNGITFQFFSFQVWREFSRCPPWSLLSSLFFPLMYLCCFFAKVKNDRGYLFTWSLFVASLLIYGVVVETGDRATHGNFSFQLIICMFMLFLMTLKKFSFELMSRPLLNRKTVLVGGAFLGHVFSEILYFYKIWFIGNAG